MTNEWIRIHDIIRFVGAHYGVTYAENSRETFGKQALYHFHTAALVEDNGKVRECKSRTSNNQYSRIKYALKRCWREFAANHTCANSSTNTVKHSVHLTH
ncbi:MAG: hypothetical protein R3Y67_07630 [Eubacteriales bacterium]